MITVMTPTYNRAHTLGRVYKSLISQSSKNFVWLVVDDGSTDGTKELVRRFIDEKKIEIRYFYKPNGGRHTALNFAAEVANTEWMINLDSDDTFTENAIELLEKEIRSIPPEKKEKIWLISGRCVDSQTGLLVGLPWKSGINSLTGKKLRKAILKSPGEKSNCRKVSVLRKFPFPEYPDAKFVAENTVWEYINNFYDQWCTDSVFRVYYQDSPDSLGKGKVHSTQRRQANYYNYITYLNQCRTYLRMRHMFFEIRTALCFNAILLNRSLMQVRSDLHSKTDQMMVMLLWLPMKLYILLTSKKR